jgi:ferritin
MYDHVVKTLIEEVEGIKGYYKMRAVARERGNEDLAFWIQQIIEDERTHIEWIWNYLKEHNVDTSVVDHMCMEVLE